MCIDTFSKQSTDFYFGCICVFQKLCLDTMDMEEVKVVIVPGNGAGNVEAANWYGWLHYKLKENSKILVSQHFEVPIILLDTTFFYQIVPLI